MNNSLRPRDLAPALLVIVVWGLNFAVIKVGVAGVTPLLLGALFTALSFGFAGRLPLHPEHQQYLFVPASIATLMSGFLILTRGRRITAESESGERLREHRTQFRNTLGDDGLAFLQIGDALGQTVKLALGGGATLLDLRIGFLARLMYDCGGLDVRLLALGRGIRIGLVASVLGLTDQLIGFPLGRHTTLFEVLQQFVEHMALLGPKR